MFDKMSDVDLMKMAARVYHAERCAAEAYYGFNPVVDTLKDTLSRMEKIGENPTYQEADYVSQMQEEQGAARMVWRAAERNWQLVVCELLRRGLPTVVEELEKFFWA